MTESEITTYDKVPYETSSFPETHPDNLATVGSLFGMKVARVDSCRVLELGCARGENLIPLASALPRSVFVGVDLSKKQIEYGQDTIQTLGLNNIELKHMSITDITPDLGEFDYIITHGIYSWVPKAVQNKIVEVSRHNLAPHGIAYVSYNTYPGWHMRGIIRDMMLYHCKQFAEPAQYVGQARAFLDFVTQSLKDGNSPHVTLLNNELAGIKNMPDWYLFHDYLEVVNDPIYFHEFAERAATQGLQYLADTPLSSMLIDKFPPQVKDTLHKVAPNLIRMEQYKDFLCNRMFRRSLLCHSGIALNRSITHDKVRSLFVASRLAPVDSSLDVKSPAEAEFRSPSGVSVKINFPLAKAAFLHLSRIWPSWCSFDSLFETSRSLIGAPSISDKLESEADAQRLARNLLRLYFDDLLELHAYASPLSPQPHNCPAVSAVARLQARRNCKVTNLRHEPLMLEGALREMVAFLDGTKAQVDLLRIVTGMKDAGIISPQNSQAESQDAILNDLLSKLAKSALLLA